MLVLFSTGIEENAPRAILEHYKRSCIAISFARFNCAHCQCIAILSFIRGPPAFGSPSRAGTNELREITNLTDWTIWPFIHPGLAGSEPICKSVHWVYILELCYGPVTETASITACHKGGSSLAVEPDLLSSHLPKELRRSGFIESFAVSERPNVSSSRYVFLSLLQIVYPSHQLPTISRAISSTNAL